MTHAHKIKGLWLNHINCVPLDYFRNLKATYDALTMSNQLLRVRLHPI